jgi:hypothetical protein
MTRSGATQFVAPIRRIEYNETVASGTKAAHGL